MDQLSPSLQSLSKNSINRTPSFEGLKNFALQTLRELSQQLGDYLSTETESEDLILEIELTST